MNARILHTRRMARPMNYSGELADLRRFEANYAERCR